MLVAATSLALRQMSCHLCARRRDVPRQCPKRKLRAPPPSERYRSHCDRFHRLPLLCLYFHSFHQLTTLFLIWHYRKDSSEPNSTLCGRRCRRTSSKLLRRRIFASAFASAAHDETQAGGGWLAGDVWMKGGVAACYYYPSVRTQRSGGHRPNMTAPASQHNPFVCIAQIASHKTTGTHAPES